MNPTAPKERHPKLTRHELGRYIVADVIDRMQIALSERMALDKALMRQLQNALAALGEKEGHE